MRCRNHIPYGNGIVRVGIHIEDLWVSSPDRIESPSGLHVLQCKDELRRPLITISAMVVLVGLIAGGMVYFSSSSKSLALPLLLLLPCACSAILFYFLSYKQFGIKICNEDVSYYCASKWLKLNPRWDLRCVARPVDFIGKHRRIFGDSAFGVFLSVSDSSAPSRELLVAVTPDKEKAEFVQEVLVASFPSVHIDTTVGAGSQTVIPCSCKSHQLERIWL